MNKASKRSGGAGYAGLGGLDVGEILKVMAAVLAENEGALGVVGSQGIKIITHDGRKTMIVTGKFMEFCLALGIL